MTVCINGLYSHAVLHSIRCSTATPADRLTQHDRRRPVIGSSGPVGCASADEVVHPQPANTVLQVVLGEESSACCPWHVCCHIHLSADSDGQVLSARLEQPVLLISGSVVATIFPEPSSHPTQRFERHTGLEPSRSLISNTVTRPTMSSSLSNHNAASYARHANFVYSAEYASPVLNLLNPQRGERIADLGCGTGELTGQIARAVGKEGFVLGIDSSESMVGRQHMFTAPACRCSGS